MSSFRRLKVVFVDLDDTLIDTFGMLITPLERLAAESFCNAVDGRFRPEDVVATALAIRRRSPAEMELKLNERLGSDYDSLSGIRNRVFSDFSVDSLVISDQVVETLSVLRPHYVLVLVTEGIERIQKGKIRHLGIGSAFEDMIFLDPGEARAKEAAIAVFLAGQGIEAREAVIVGNRLDREIAAGRRLGITTIWIRKGEGSEMVPGKENEPDFTIRDFAELPAALMAISGRG